MVTEQFTEHVSNAGQSFKVDRVNNVIPNVKILGMTSRNGRTYSEGAVRKAVSLYEGAKVNVNHPKGNAREPRDYQDRIGSHKAVKFREGDGLYGDFHFNPKHPLAEQLIYDAEHAPENVGFSHNVQATSTRKDGRVVVENIESVNSVDLVADPATTRGMFEGIEPTTEPNTETNTEGTNMTLDISKLTLEQLSSRDDLKTAIVQEHLQSEAGKAQAAELKRLQEAVAGYELKEKAAAKLARINGMVTEAKLPAKLVTPVFLESLVAAADDKAVAALIADRATLAEGISKPQRRGPQSQEQTFESVGAGTGKSPWANRAPARA